MSERDLKCPGCAGFDKESSSGCMFKDLKQEEKKDKIRCSSCGSEIDAKKLKSNTSSGQDRVCPDCGQKIII